MPRPEGKLENFIWKDEVKKQVYVRTRPEPGAKKAVTLYKTLGVKNGLSLVECQLVTGRTHQIRVHMAYIGHPLCGDTVYGTKSRARAGGPVPPRPAAAVPPPRPPGKRWSWNAPCRTGSRWF